MTFLNYADINIPKRYCHNMFSFLFSFLQRTPVLNYTPKNNYCNPRLFLFLKFRYRLIIFLVILTHFIHSYSYVFLFQHELLLLYDPLQQNVLQRCLLLEGNAFRYDAIKKKIFYNQIYVINRRINCQKMRVKKKILPNEE